MARLPRLVLPGHAHWVIQRGHGGRPVFVDDGDRAAFLDALQQASRALRVRVLAWALPAHEVQLLLVPEDGEALGRLMQSVGRRFVAGYNRRHGCLGTLWEGRYRAAAVESGTTLLQVLAAIDGLPAAGGATSLQQRLLGQGNALLHDPPEFWSLGNTPFEREAGWRRCVADSLAPGALAAWRSAALGGWPVGSAAFRAAAEAATQRPAQPRRPGRPRKQAAADAEAGAGAGSAATGR